MTTSVRDAMTNNPKSVEATTPIVEALLRIDRDEIGRSDLADRRRSNIFPFRDDTKDDVAVGDHADQATVVDRRERSDVELLQQLRSFDDRRRRIDALRIVRHCITNARRHRSSSRVSMFMR